MTVSSPPSSSRQSTTPCSSTSSSPAAPKTSSARQSSENLNSRVIFSAPSMRLPSGEEKSAAIAFASTASASRSERKRFCRMRSISARTASSLSVREKSIYCSTRCVAVPRSAPRRGFSARAKSGTRKLRGACGAIAAASSSGSARSFSSVAVTLLGSETASLCG